MQASNSSFSLSSCSFSFPLCVSGVTRRLRLSNEMVDHEQRRRAMKRQRSASGSYDLSTGTRSGDEDSSSMSIRGGDPGQSNSKGCYSLLFAAKAA